ncbi:MAG: response regulator [Desulfocapsaceae bacterium]|nr:response regulator [Desulfocapsaceae bacterium]
MRVLNVDDKDENRYLVESLLKGNAFEVVSAQNGAEGLALLQSSQFDLIISDILMPVMDGFQFCRRVKADEKFRHIPFIIYTATYTGPQDEAFALQIGADKFIQKPCEPDIFLSAVHHLLNTAKHAESNSYRFKSIPEDEVLKLYSERLVRKLEQKMLQLEKEVQARKIAEEILIQNEKKYKSLFNSIRDAILVADMDRTILDCNQAFMDLFGYSPAEIKGENTVFIYANENEFRRIGAALEDDADDSPHIYSVQFKTKNDSVFPGEINIFFLRDEDGAITGYIALIRDITERVRANKTQKNLESQLHQAQKMESIGRLAGGVAHDYNNMLGVIIGYSELALKKLNFGDNLYDELHAIHEAAIRSADITRQLLAFARKQTITPQILYLNETVHGMLKMLRRLMGEDIALAWIPGQDLWPVRMDPSQVDQILANLCVNARDAIPGVGKVTIETQNTSVDEACCAVSAGFNSGDYVLLTVSDDGCGMDEETMANIFEPFFTTKELGKGTGLGLATIYGIVSQNTGFIDVHSEFGLGTIFRIYLPRHKGFLQQREYEELVEIAIQGQETILLVEDEPAILDITATQLKGLGYTVLAASTPGEAITVAQKNLERIDLLITDIVMPEMNGHQLSDTLLLSYPNIKTLFMSGYTSHTAGQGLLIEGGNFIQKPFSINDLSVKVRAALKIGHK